MRVKVGEVYGWKHDASKITELEISNEYELVRYCCLGLKIDPKDYSSKLRRFLVEEEIREIIE